MVIPQPPSQHAGGLRVGGPLLHALGIAQRGQSLQQIDKAFTLAPIALAKGVAQVLAAWLGLQVGAAVWRTANIGWRSGDAANGCGPEAAARPRVAGTPPVAACARFTGPSKPAAKPVGVTMRVPLALSLLSSGLMSSTPKPRANSSYMPLRRSPRLSMSSERR